MNKKIGTIYLILLLGLIIRLFLSHLPAFESDQNAFRFWAQRLAELGPANFYSKDVFTNNPLGILYFFWLIGSLKDFFLPFTPFDFHIDPLLKLAANFSDILTGSIIYKILKEKLNNKLAILGSTLYIFNPALLFNSAIWGQYDSVAILFLVLSVYFIFIKKSPVICSIFFSLAWITKPQSLELVPFLFIFFIKNFKLEQLGYSLMAFVITAFLVYYPFFPNNPFYGVYYINLGSTNLFNCTSCNAFNLWGAIGNWQNDMNLFLSIPLLNWGGLLLLIVLLIIYKSNKLVGNQIFLIMSLTMLSFFMLLTRMHERYYLYFIPFLLISTMLLKSRILMGFYLFFSLISLLNLYAPYAYYNNLAKITNLPVNKLMNNFQSLSLISFLGFVLLFLYFLKSFKNNIKQNEI